jgi:drug/metabolite transporter (DMT)-like permease
MGILIIIFVSLLWSMVGIFVKFSAEMVDSSTITFMRFFVGVILLGIIYVVKYGRPRIRTADRWIWTGAIGKSANYFLENIGIIIGLSYGYIVAAPIYNVLLLLASAFILKEMITRKDWIGAILSIAGVIMIMLDGMSLAEMLQDKGFLHLIFIFSAFGVTAHMLSQKKLVQRMDPLIMNLSVFFWCTVISAIPFSVMHEFKGFQFSSFFSLIALGSITGLSFVLFSHALRTVPLFLATLISNFGVLFTVLWGVLFFGEPVSGHVISGVILFTIGLIIGNWPTRRRLTISD